MPKNNALNNSSESMTTDTFVNAGTTVTAGTGLTVTTGPTTINSGTDPIQIGTDATAHAITVGNTTGATSVSLISGTGSITMQTTGTGDVLIDSDDTILIDADGVIEINSSAGSINIGNDADAQAINIGTGAAARTITIGNITGATALNLDIGTGDFTLDSATGRIITALDTGEVTKPLQPAFLALLSSSTANNVTGDGTNYTVIFDNEIFDQNSDYNNATGVFTAPVTGKYYFKTTIMATNLAAASDPYSINITTTARTYVSPYLAAGPVRSGATFLNIEASAFCDMTAGDTVTFGIVIAGGTKTVGVYAFGFTLAAGYLVC